MKSNASPCIVTLMYHRIDLPDTNPWSICVSPENFEKQICFLKDNYNVISVDELLDQITSGDIIEKSICITFDDGYADNFIHAKPVLKKYDCSATFFIATAFINQPYCFWWDDVELIFLHTKKLPACLTVQIGNETCNYHINETELTSKQSLQHKKWKWYQSPPTTRCNIFLSLWKKLTALPYEKIEVIIHELKKWSHYDEQNFRIRAVMNNEQLHQLSSNKLCKLALHTHHHYDLTVQDKAVQHKEIISAKNILQQQFNIDSTHLSYPFGKFNDDTLQVANDLNLDACFTTEATVSNATSNKYALGRFQPFNWNEKTFGKYLHEWFKSGRQTI